MLISAAYLALAVARNARGAAGGVLAYRNLADVGLTDLGAEFRS
jgi:hypothetical protein